MWVDVLIHISYPSFAKIIEPSSLKNSFHEVTGKKTKKTDGNMAYCSCPND